MEELLAAIVGGLLSALGGFVYSRYKMRFTKAISMLVARDDVFDAAVELVLRYNEPDQPGAWKQRKVAAALAKRFPDANARYLNKVIEAAVDEVL